VAYVEGDEGGVGSGREEARGGGGECEGEDGGGVGGVRLGKGEVSVGC
jgi:hypothetical protein